MPFNLEYVTKLVAEESAKAPGAAQGPQYTYNTEARLPYRPCAYKHTCPHGAS